MKERKRGCFVKHRVYPATAAKRNKRINQSAVNIEPPFNLVAKGTAVHAFCAGVGGRVSVFTTEMGAITMMLEGADGMGLDVIFDEDEESTSSVSPDVALDQQQALERKRQLAQLVKELASDVRTHIR